MLEVLSQKPLANLCKKGSLTNHLQIYVRRALYKTISKFISQKPLANLCKKGSL